MILITWYHINEGGCMHMGVAWAQRCRPWHRAFAQSSNSVPNVAEINNTQTIKPIPVVSIPLDYVTSAHLAVKKNQTWAQGFRSKNGTELLIFLKCDFLAILAAVHQNICHFWNTEAKLDKIGMLENETFMFGDLALFGMTLTWPWPQLESDVKMSVSIEFYVKMTH